MDYTLIAVGVVALFLFTVEPSCLGLYNVVSMSLGAIGLVYAAYGTSFFWQSRIIDFDWKLMNGHFLRKLICLVILLPFSLTFVLEQVNRVRCAQEEERKCLSKELVYDEQLYAQGDSLPVFIRERQQSPNLLWTVYCHFVDPGSQPMATSAVGRGWAAFFAILGVFLLNGLLISILTNWFDKRRDHWLRGEIRYSRRNFKKNRYAVVIGANEIVASVIKNLLNRTEEKINFKCEGENEYVILQTRKEALEVREELSSYLSEAELRRVVIYNALRDSKSELEKLYLDYATEIYVLGESTLQDSGETYHDSLNMKCVNLIAECLEACCSKREGEEENEKTRIHRKVCKVMFEYQTTYSIFQFSDLPPKVNRYIVFIPFNRYESWAQRVMVEGVFYDDEGERADSIRYTPLDGSGIPADSDEYVHFVVVGMSKMGIAMGVQALLQAHYLNAGKVRSRITFIDTHADEEMAFFKGRYESLFELTRYKYIDANRCPVSKLDGRVGWTDPAVQKDYPWKHLSEHSENFIDVELEFVKGEIESDGVRAYLRRLAEDGQSKLTLAICLTQTHQAVAASLYLPLEIYKKVQEIWVYQREAGDIVTNLIRTEEKNKRYEKLRPFGMLHGQYMRDRSLYLKALLAHDAYLWKGKIHEMDMADKNTYKKSRAAWKSLSIAHKWSNKFFVDTIYEKIRGVFPGIVTDTDTSGSYKEKLFAVHDRKDLMTNLAQALKRYENELAVCEHNRWNVQQLLMGFRPCEEVQEQECIVLNKEYKCKYEAVVGCPEDAPEYERLQAEKEATRQRFKEKKEALKSCEDHIHPNLCSYEHLDEVDFGAKDYDKFLNNAIPAILVLVDGYDYEELKNKKRV